MSCFELVRIGILRYAGKKHWLTYILVWMVNWILVVCRILPTIISEGYVEIIKISGLVSFFRNFKHISPMENAIVRDFRGTFCQVYVGRAR